MKRSAQQISLYILFKGPCRGDVFLPPTVCSWCGFEGIIEGIRKVCWILRVEVNVGGRGRSLKVWGGICKRLLA